MNLQNSKISTDALTGLYNRRMLYRQLETKTMNVPAGFKLFAVIIDLDEFKSINDNYGHAMGDDALVKSASLLRGVCDSNDDFLARMGGDEFAIVCLRAHDVGIPEIIPQIREEIARFNKNVAVPYRLSMSIGVGVYGDDGADSIDGLMYNSDRNMYEEKNSKKAKRQSTVNG